MFLAQPLYVCNNCDAHHLPKWINPCLISTS